MDLQPLHEISIEVGHVQAIGFDTRIARAIVRGGVSGCGLRRLRRWRRPGSGSCRRRLDVQRRPGGQGRIRRAQSGDRSATGSQALPATDPQFIQYQQQLQRVTELAAAPGVDSIFANHHPALGYTAVAGSVPIGAYQ